jgi:Ni,Fe-hydrogenase III large subunit
MSPLSRFTALRAGGIVPLEAIPDLSWSDFAEALLQGVARRQRVVAYFGTAAGSAVRLHLVLADDAASELAVASTRIAGGSFPSLAAECPQVHLFEREIAEQHGLEADGHPWPRPVRFERSRAPRGGAPKAPAVAGVIDFYTVSGEEVHEVGVGPVHAGVIEPGHFRFQCHGEEVFHLEISLGYQHRGVERALVGGPHRRSMAYAETVAGDTTIGHGTAYCELYEALARSRVPTRAAALRGVALELERLANHVGDLGALAGDIAYLPTASACGRLRGDFLNLTAELCGSRFGRGLVRPGGCGFDVDPGLATRMLDRLEAAAADCRSAIELLWDSSSVMARFEGTGTVSHEAALMLGLTGPAARACGLDRDARRDHPSGIFRFQHIPVALADTGDVLARAYVRWLEIQRSLAFVREQLRSLPKGGVLGQAGALAPSRLAVSLIEGWRGEICHVAITGENGRFERYKIVDPSFHGWAALAWAMRGQQLSDFPLCNKSFNLSYCGHDL